MLEWLTSEVFVAWWANVLDHARKNEALAGLSGIEYRKAWNKLHRERCRIASRAFRHRNPGITRIYWKRTHNGELPKTTLNRRSQKKATQAGLPWGPVEDEILMRGENTEGELVEMLGRSIVAIQRRKWRLRKAEQEEARMTKGGKSA